MHPRCTKYVQCTPYLLSSRPVTGYNFEKNVLKWTGQYF